MQEIRDRMLVCEKKFENSRGEKPWVITVPSCNCKNGEIDKLNERRQGVKNCGCKKHHECKVSPKSSPERQEEPHASVNLLDKYISSQRSYDGRRLFEIDGTEQLIANSRRGVWHRAATSVLSRSKSLRREIESPDIPPPTQYGPMSALIELRGFKVQNIQRRIDTIIAALASGDTNFLDDNVVPDGNTQNSPERNQEREHVTESKLETTEKPIAKPKVVKKKKRKEQETMPTNFKPYRPIRGMKRNLKLEKARTRPYNADYKHKSKQQHETSHATPEESAQSNIKIAQPTENKPLGPLPWREQRVAFMRSPPQESLRWRMNYLLTRELLAKELLAKKPKQPEWVKRKNFLLILMAVDDVNICRLFPVSEVGLRMNRRVLLHLQKKKTNLSTKKLIVNQ
eukprot:m.95319 g.95319  ORF g.95319 m.95319 type:complete len:399 (+) comp13486_c0_seq3:425-1621(+)